MTLKQRPLEKAWEELIAIVKPTDAQREQFEKYATYLLERNEDFNLTAINDVPGVLRQHFEDSAALANFMDLSKVTTIADVGTGAGFPGIPLKILFPHIRVILIEVTHKKREFLFDVIELLKLENIEVCDLDWRTFLRNTEDAIDLFVTRAALDDQELMRMFKPACTYKGSTLVYWASKDWQAHPKTAPFVERIESYRLGHKDRRLVFMKAGLQAKQ